MIGNIGKKLGMTQLFNSAGQQIPCTVIEAEPNPVLAVTNTSTLKTLQLGGLGTQKLTRESAEGLLDLGVVGAARDAEQLVVVAVGRRHQASS